MPRKLLLLVFLVSGALGLSYEVLWLRLFTFVLGSDLQSTSAVVAAFLLGLAAGGWLLGKRADRAENLLRWYGFLELALATLQGVAYLLFSSLDPVYKHLLSWMPYSGTKWLVFVVAFGFVSLPACLIGGTLPVLVKGFTRESGSVDRDTALLYGLNTLGATLGAILLVYAAIPACGYAGSFLLVTLSSAALGLGALALSCRVRREQPSAVQPDAAADTPGGAESVPPWIRNGILLAYGLSGFAALGYEIVWNRQLVFLFHGTLKSFALILAIYLLGIALGSLLAWRLSTLSFRRAIAFGVLEWGAGVMGLASLVVVWRAGVGAELLLCIFFATFCLGTAFPMAIQLHHRSLASAGRTVGEVYAANTIGCILGSLLSGFVLVPWLGSLRTMLSLCLLHLVVGSAFLGRASAALASSAGAALLVVGVAILLPADALWQKSYPWGRLVHWQENAYQVLAITEREGERELWAGPFLSGSTSRREVQRLQGHLAMLFHPKPDRVLEIGYGIGEILRCILRHQPRQVDLVEIDPDMIPMADRFFEQSNERSSTDPSVTVHVMDGRHFLASTSVRYDVIMSDSFFIASEASTRLYTQEHFEQGAAHLANGGVMAAWVPLNLGFARDGAILSTFARVFPYVFVWQRFQVLFLFGMNEPPRVDLGRFQERFESTALADLSPEGDVHYLGLLSGFRMGPEEYRALFPASAPYGVHRDLSPTLDYLPQNDFDPLPPWLRGIELGSMGCLLPFSLQDRQDTQREVTAAVRSQAEADGHFRAAREVLGLTAGLPMTRFEASAPELADARRLLDEALAAFPQHTGAARLRGEVLRRTPPSQGPPR